MLGRRALWLGLVSCALGPLLRAQAPCNGTPAYTPCEFLFELNEQEAAAHPNPYASLRLHAEFRSPRYKTYLMPAYWDGGRRMVIRFTPTDDGEWVYRITSNLPRLEGQQGKFSAGASAAPGFIRTANVHHWAYTENNQPHLWMGATCDPALLADDAAFRQFVDTRAQQKFNHLRITVPGEDAVQAYSGPDQVKPAYFQRLDERIKYVNSKGITADLVLAGREHLTALFPNWEQRERYVRYVIARYAPMNVTWLGIADFEAYPDGRALMKEIGTLLKRGDPYDHPRTAAAAATSGPLLGDEWMNFTAYGSTDDQIAAIEHQLYAVPAVSFGVVGADAAALRRNLWNAAMDGAYPAWAATKGDAAGQWTAWFDFFAGTRHWELEPYFDVDGGRALALEGVEYIVYVEKPSGPVELLVERHGYDVAWINPITGERLKQKNFKGERFTGEPPDRAHDWVLHVSREGHKEGMLRSYKFESRRIILQEIEVATAKVPFEIEQPAHDPLKAGTPVPYSVKLKRETRATRSMMYLWTGDAASGGKGYRVLGTGAKGAMTVPPTLSDNWPATLLVRLYGMNANGKVYSLDRPYQVVR